MPQPKKINISGLLKQLNQFGDEGKRYVLAITNGTARNISEDAKLKAPANYGALRLGIGFDEATEKDGIAYVFSKEAYSGYVEFGTGPQVQIPSGFEQLASTWKGRASGKFDIFLDDIRDWCRRKNIDVKLAYPIAVAILRRGLKPQPFIIPAYIIGTNKYKGKLEQAINKLTKEYNNKK